MPADKTDQTFESELDEVINKLHAHGIGCYCDDEEGGYTRSEAKEALLSKYHSELERIIGEDDTVSTTDLTKSATPHRDARNIERNELRYEQRAAAGIEDKAA